MVLTGTAVVAWQGSRGDAVTQDSYYSTDDVMSRLDRLESKIDTIGAQVTGTGGSTDIGPYDFGLLKSRVEDIATAVGAGSGYSSLTKIESEVREIKNWVSEILQSHQARPLPADGSVKGRHPSAPAPVASGRLTRLGHVARADGDGRAIGSKRIESTTDWSSAMSASDVPGK